MQTFHCVEQKSNINQNCFLNLRHSLLVQILHLIFGNVDQHFFVSILICIEIKIVILFKFISTESAEIKFE